MNPLLLIGSRNYPVSGHRQKPGGPWIEVITNEFAPPLVLDSPFEWHRLETGNPPNTGTHFYRVNFTVD
jgi:hypothetical protein